MDQRMSKRLQEEELDTNVISVFCLYWLSNTCKIHERRETYSIKLVNQTMKFMVIFNVFFCFVDIY